MLDHPTSRGVAGRREADFTPPHARPLARRANLLETARIARRNLLETIPALAYRRPILSGRTVMPWHMVMEPAALRRVLADNLENYPKSPATQRLLRPAIGRSIFASEGEDWRWQRRAAAPIFAPRRLDALAPMMTAAALAAQARIDRAVVSGFAGRGVACAQAEMNAAAFDVARSALLFGADAETLGDGLGHRAVASDLQRFIDTVAKVSWLDLLGAPDWAPRPAELLNGDLMTRSVAALDQLIAARRRARRSDPPGAQPDLVDYLLAAEDPETGRRMDDATLRNNLLAFLIAGHETTALALAWSLYLLAHDAGAQERAAAEAQAALDGAAAAEARHLPALGYIGQVIDEAMRLYPPAAMLSRRAVAADRLCGRRIAAGDIVILPIYALHRHDALWERPMKFEPDRFAPAPAKARDRYAYLPFGAGPRVCIGAAFALMEAKILLASLIARYRVAPRAGAPAPEPTLTVTLRPKNGMPLSFERRRTAV